MHRQPAVQSGQTAGSVTMARYRRLIPILFCVSLFFLVIHVLDDALNLGEPRDWGVSTPEFLLIVASMYLIVPPFGALLARRGKVFGFVIVMLYAFQAFYGAGLNHLRHLSGDFGGIGIVGRALMALGVDCLNMRGHGFITGVLSMLGCGVTSPHTHVWWSTAVAAIDTLLNIPLIILCALAVVQGWRENRALQTQLAPREQSALPMHSK
jgi:hypothetical protein